MSKQVNAIRKLLVLALTGSLFAFMSCSKDSFEEELSTDSTEEFVVAALTTSLVQAENYDAQNGVQVVGGSKVGYINNNDWIRFEDFDFEGASSISINASSSRSGGTVEVRAGGPNGDLLGTVNVSNTGGWNNFQNFSGSIDDDSSNSDTIPCF